MTKRKRVIQIAAVLITGIICYLAYVQLLYQSTEVNSNIFAMQASIPAHTADVWAVKFSPNGKMLASASVDSTVKIWDRESRSLIHTLRHPIGVTYLAFSNDSFMLATACYDEKVRIWKMPEGLLMKEFTGHKKTVWSVCFSPDSKLLASSGEDATIKLWDVQSGQLLKTLTGHSLTIWDIKFTKDGKYLVSGSYDRTLKIWNVESEKMVADLKDHSDAIVAIAMSPDGKLMASTSDDKTIKIWNTASWSLIRTLKTPEHNQAADFSPDSKWLLTGGRDKPSAGELLQNFFGDSHYNKGVSMRLWDVQSGELLQTFSHHANDVNDVAFSPDGKWIVSGSSDRTIELWKITNR